jgi:hypothetical protein
MARPLLKVTAVRSLLIVLLAAGCYGPIPVYRVQRTVRVPHPAAPLWSGAPLQGPAELSIGASSVGDTRAPRLVDHDASIETPSTMVRGELRIRAGTFGQVALLVDHAIESTFTALDPTQAPVPSGGATGLGAAVRYSVHFDSAPELSIGLGIEGMVRTLSSVEYRSCVANCDGVPTQEMITSSDNLAMLAFQVTPAYRTGPWTFYAGAYAAPHPTVVRKGQELYSVDYDTELERGDYNLVLHAGAEYRLGYVSLLAQVQRDMTADPVAYGPSFGFAIAGRIPELPPR